MSFRKILGGSSSDMYIFLTMTARSKLNRIKQLKFSKALMVLMHVVVNKLALVKELCISI